MLGSLWPYMHAIMSNHHNLASLCGGYILLFQVYTVNRESKYIVVQNVHALGVKQELLKLFSLYGEIEEWVASAEAKDKPCDLRHNIGLAP